jgi:hypothetical protein
MYKLISVTGRKRALSSLNKELSFRLPALEQLKDLISEPLAFMTVLSVGGGGGESRLLSDMVVKFKYIEAELYANQLLRYMNEVVPETRKVIIDKALALSILEKEIERNERDTEDSDSSTRHLEQLAIMLEPVINETVESLNILCVSYVKAVNLAEYIKRTLVFKNDDLYFIYKELARIVLKDIALVNRDRIGTYDGMSAVSVPNFGNAMVVAPSDMRDEGKPLILIDNNLILAKISERAELYEVFSDACDISKFCDQVKVLIESGLRAYKEDYSTPDTFDSISAIREGLEQGLLDLQTFLAQSEHVVIDEMPAEVFNREYLPPIRRMVNALVKMLK